MGRRKGRQEGARGQPGRQNLAEMGPKWSQEGAKREPKWSREAEKCLAGALESKDAAREPTQGLSQFAKEAQKRPKRGPKGVQKVAKKAILTEKAVAEAVFVDFFGRRCF